MPRGIPKTGYRASGAGRPKKYGEDTKLTRAPVSIAGKFDELITFLKELNEEITAWETEINGKDIKTNPRYSKAKVLAESIRERISALDMKLED